MGRPDAVVDRSPRQLTVPEQVFTEAGSTLGPASSDLPATGRRAARGPAAGRPTAPAREAAVIVVRAIVEALGGVRPVSHLAGWTTPRLQNDLERIAAQLSDRRRGQVRSVRVSEPRPGVAEVSAVISRGARAAALALRMEATGGRWRVTTLQVG
ncbi:MULTISPECIES: Rv3235 family protein [unclassified Frankia]|uniref:Rv3235 family protein n=1 Tax=Frankia TaxID=1854 RepID=UPI00351D5DFA